MVCTWRMWIQWYYFSKLNQKVNYPKMTFDPTSVEVTYVTLPKDHFIQVPWKYVKVCGYSDPFFQKLEPKVMEHLDDLWPQVCWGHMCDATQESLCPSPMGIHQCMWIQWSILQNSTHIYIHTTYYIRTTYTMSDHNSLFWTKFRRDKNSKGVVIWASGYGWRSGCSRAFHQWGRGSISSRARWACEFGSQSILARAGFLRVLRFPPASKIVSSLHSLKFIPNFPCMRLEYSTCYCWPTRY